MSVLVSAVVLFSVSEDSSGSVSLTALVFSSADISTDLSSSFPVIVSDPTFSDSTFAANVVSRVDDMILSSLASSEVPFLPFPVQDIRNAPAKRIPIKYSLFLFITHFSPYTFYYSFFTELFRSSGISMFRIDHTLSYIRFALFQQ